MKRPTPLLPHRQRSSRVPNQAPWLRSVLASFGCIAPLGCSFDEQDRVLEGQTPEAVQAGEESASDAENGTVQLQLLTQASSGTKYRLRNATISVTGPQTVTFNTETNPDLTTLSADVSPGNYQATLHAGWKLEKVTPPTAQDVEATLVSTNPAAFTVQSNARVSVPLSFRVGPDVTGPTGAFDVLLEVTEVPPTGGGTCAECEATACGAQLQACGDASNGSKCTSLIACLASTSCADGATESAEIVQGCLCGTYSAIDCAGGDADGPCLAQGQLAASTGANPTSVLNTLVRWDNVDFAAGDAKELALCHLTNCKAQCTQY